MHQQIFYLSHLLCFIFQNMESTMNLHARPYPAHHFLNAKHCFLLPRERALPERPLEMEYFYSVRTVNPIWGREGILYTPGARWR
ncbi:hypothetical protein CEXT_165161 [Caerostris extrusa]|uniref:Secreted protein n=1 Tax=Caerostris extrusa TaxID=172846 RepID=A0AAV4XVT2_CAEEX|nr:hypothetical protein CEXT_165161 [Caerostris extrusa]